MSGRREDDRAPGGVRRMRERQARAEQVADAALRAHFQGVPRPTLSPFFEPRVVSRARTENAEPALDRRARRLLRAYWLVAAAVSLVLLWRTPWPAAGTGGGLLLGVALAVVVAFPAWLLARLRGGLFSFLLRVFE